MKAGQHAVSLVVAAALGMTLTAAADEGSSVTETVDESGITVVSSTHERFTMMSPGETVSWYMDVSSAHEPADLGLRLMPSGEMNASLSIYDCTVADDCDALISDRTFVAGDDLVVEGFENTMNLRIDVAAGDDLDQNARMSLAALVTGTDASVSVGVPGTGTTPVVTPADPSAPRPSVPEAGETTPVESSTPEQGASQDTPPAASGNSTPPQADGTPAAPGESTVSPQASSWPASTVGSSASEVASDTGLQVVPQVLSPHSEPVFRGVLAATGGNVLPILILGLTFIGAGGIVLARRKHLSSMH